MYQLLCVQCMRILGQRWKAEADAAEPSNDSACMPLPSAQLPTAPAATAAHTTRAAASRATAQSPLKLSESPLDPSTASARGDSTFISTASPSSAHPINAHAHPENTAGTADPLLGTSRGVTSEPSGSEASTAETSESAAAAGAVGGRATGIESDMHESGSGGWLCMSMHGGFPRGGGG